MPRTEKSIRRDIIIINIILVNICSKSSYYIYRCLSAKSVSLPSILRLFVSKLSHNIAYYLSCRSRGLPLTHGFFLFCNSKPVEYVSGYCGKSKKCTNTIRFILIRRKHCQNISILDVSIITWSEKTRRRFSRDRLWRVKPNSDIKICVRYRMIKLFYDILV